MFGRREAENKYVSVHINLMGQGWHDVLYDKDLLSVKALWSIAVLTFYLREGGCQKCEE